MIALSQTACCLPPELGAGFRRCLAGRKLPRIGPPKRTLACGGGDYLLGDGWAPDGSLCVAVGALLWRAAAA
jgi:hypothetical protein